MAETGSLYSSVLIASAFYLWIVTKLKDLEMKRERGFCKLIFLSSRILLKENVCK